MLKFVLNKIRALFSFHIWKYYNPFNRTCIKCDRHEVKHGYHMNAIGQWEVFNEGDKSKLCNK